MCTKCDTNQALKRYKSDTQRYKSSTHEVQIRYKLGTYKVQIMPLRARARDAGVRVIKTLFKYSKNIYII